jgi:chemotaxis protein methyltransferase CheR
MTAAEAPARGRGPIPGETYFFRDHGQFDVIRNHLLPSLLHRRAATRTLRLWSAGVSTGEEAYSLAIVLRELLAGDDSWRIRLVGTDVDGDALAAARHGVYGAWSFRMVDPSVRDRYFTRHGGEWVLVPEIRRMVTFQRHDLLREPLPPSGFAADAVDLVLCRNLFIYLPAEVVAGLVPRLARTLSPGGFLLTAHGEIHGRTGDTLETVAFPESIVYRRRVPDGTGTSRRRLSWPGAAPAPAVNAGLTAVHARVADGDGDSIPAPDGTPADRLRAHTYYLLARVAKERGNRADAYDGLRKALYIDPAFVPAYVDLAALCEIDGYASRARSLRAAALACLDRLAPDTLIAPCDLTAAELRMRIAAILE